MKLFLLLFTLLTVTLPAFAGGPLSVATGASVTDPSLAAPTRWGSATGTVVTLNPDGGTCGPYSNAETLTMLDEALANWTDSSDVDFTFNVLANTVGDINGDNYGNYLIDEPDSNNDLAINDGLTPIVFDDDGAVIDAIFGAVQHLSIFGFASPALFASDYSQIFDGQAVFNCRCVVGNLPACSTFTISDNLLKLTMTHEMGHFMGLTHTQINLDIRDDDITSNDYGIPVMIPEIDANHTNNSSLEAIATPTADDIAAMATIYPSTTFESSHSKVTGTITNINGDPMRCVDVQAIPTDRTKAVSSITGAYAIATDDNTDYVVNTANCTSGCGDFQLYLTPGIAYTLSAKTIDSTFVSSKAIFPCRDAQLPNCDECADGDTTCVDTCLKETSLGTVVTASDTAGTTIALGNLQTLSTGGSPVATTTTNSKAGCALITSAQKSHGNGIMVAIGLLILLSFPRRRESNINPRSPLSRG